jgi:hypothetical protein
MCRKTNFQITEVGAFMLLKIGVCICNAPNIQFNSIFLLERAEQRRDPNHKRTVTIIKTINPVSPKDLKSVCMYIQQTLDIHDHPAVNCCQ